MFWSSVNLTGNQTVVHEIVHEQEGKRCDICNICKADITGRTGAHAEQTFEEEGWPHTGYSIEYVVTQPEWYETVVDQEAYDKTVTTVYRCSKCGAWQ